MTNSLSSLTPSIAPLSGNAASKAKTPTTGQPADSAGSFVSQFLNSCGHQQGSKPGSSQSNTSSESLMSMVDASNTSTQSASLYSMASGSLDSTDF